MMSKYKDWQWIRHKACPVVICVLFTVIILASPVYVYHATGAMKSFWIIMDIDGWFTVQKNQCSKNKAYAYLRLQGLKF